MKKSQYKLFTPGPLNTSLGVKRKQILDIGSRTSEMNRLTKSIRKKLTLLAQSGDNYSCVPMQGSATFAIESMLVSLTLPYEQTLVVSNGSYGERLGKILTAYERPIVFLETDLEKSIAIDQLELCLENNPDISKIAVTQFETSTGVLNDIDAILQVANKYDCQVLVDATSSFGVIPIDYKSPSLIAVAASANKCLHSVPGVGFVIAKKIALSKIKTISHAFSLNLLEQWQEFSNSGQWRFTPPIQCLAALEEALEEYVHEGGAEARLDHYTELNELLINKLGDLAIRPVIESKYRAPMITLFALPNELAITAEKLIQVLECHSYVIYSGNKNFSNSIRIGCIGLLTSQDVLELVEKTKSALHD